MIDFAIRCRRSIRIPGGPPALLTLVCLLLMAPSASLPAEDPAADPDRPADLRASRSSRTDSAARLIPLPRSLADGRRLRPIGVYQSQIVDLIPPHYRPIRIDRLADAIENQRKRAGNDERARLRSSEYWIRVGDGVLQSEQSAIDFEADADGIIRHSLGRVNLAIEGPPRRDQSSALDVLPRLETLPDGELCAVFRAGSRLPSKVPFAWKLRGQNTGGGHLFTLRLPRSPQTRLVLMAPDDLDIDVLDGVLLRRPGPPADADERIADANIRWYRIDAGGLDRVRIRTRPIQQVGPGNSLVMRQRSMLCKVDGSGMNWNCRMALQVPQASELPPLHLRQGAVTQVRVNGVECPYSITEFNDQVQQLQVELEGQNLDYSALTVVTISGTGHWDLESGWCEIPQPIWSDPEVVQSAAAEQIEFEVPESIRTIDWDLPRGWKLSAETPVSEGNRFTVSGPPQPAGKNPRAADRCRARLASRTSVLAAETSLLLDCSKRPMRASARIAVLIDSNRVEPLKLEFEPGWSIDAVRLPVSGREIETTNVNIKRGLMIWPESAELRDSRLVIEINGSLLGSGIDRRSVPPIWLARLAGCRGPVVAAAVAPLGLHWSGDLALQVDEIELDSLNAEQRELFSAVEEDALLFRVEHGRTPPLSLQSPGVSFDVATTLTFQREGTEVIESLELDIESASQTLADLDIQTGPAAGRPAYRWSLDNEDGSPPLGLPTSDIRHRHGEDEGAYSIALADRNLRGRLLVGRRRYSLSEPMAITLPSVPSAASQQAEVRVGEKLSVTQTSPSVQRVPTPIRAIQRARATSARDAKSSAPSAEITRLRYEAVKQPRIVVAPQDSDPNVTIVWDESIRVIASSHGSDRVEAIYRVSAAEQFEIKYELGLNVVAVYRDGIAVDVLAGPDRPISLQPRSEMETVRVVWVRNHVDASWIRRCRIPQITASGVRVHSEVRLIASSDTFAPAALLQSPSLKDDPSIAVAPGGSAILIQRNLALAIGWFLSAVVFAGSWHISRRRPLVIAVSSVLLITAACLWWPWHLAIVGWLVVPAVAAAMLVTSIAWTDRGSRLLDPPAERKRESQSLMRRGSGSFSLSLPLRVIACGIALLYSLTSLTWAQEERLSSEKKEAVVDVVNLLVPVDGDGRRVGEVVYVPRNLYEDLILAGSKQTPQPAHIQAASYLLKVAALRESSEQPLQLTLEADYLVHLPEKRAVNLVQLPIAFDSVKRIETIGELNRNIQFEADRSGQVIAKLPEGSAFQLRITLNPVVSIEGVWERVFLSVPPVVAAKLVIESAQDLAAIRTGGASGGFLQEQDLRRWVHQLGPEDSLLVDLQQPSRLPAKSTQASQRRYWLNLSKERATIDFELDPPVRVGLGETYSVEVRGEAAPMLVTQNWKLRSNELTPARNRRLTFESLSDSAGPIRLLWSAPVDLTDEAAEVQLEIPDVLQPDDAERGETWIAIDADQDIDVSRTERAEVLSIDQFLERWRGYRGRHPQRAPIAVTILPSLELRRKPLTPATATIRHHLHAARGQLELTCSIRIVPGPDTGTPRTLQLPVAMRLLELSIDGTPVDHWASRTNRRHEVPLGTLSGTNPTVIELRGVVPMPSGRSFTPPQISLSPQLRIANHDYLLTRARNVGIEPTRATLVEPNSSLPDTNPELLVRGKIPVQSWSLANAEQRPVKLGGRFKIRSIDEAFDCDQLISMSRAEGGWKLQTLIQLRADAMPPYLDIEIPHQWCQSLSIEPELAWSQQDSLNPGQQVVRVRCEPQILGDQPLVVQGEFDDSDGSRVAVPIVKVLGRGQRAVSISVPNRLAAGPIQWRTSAVKATELDPLWAAAIVPGDRSTFSAVSPDSSVELAPLPTIDSEAVAVSADIQVFPQQETLLAFCRWDLIPGGSETVDVAIPSSGECLGAWTAGRAVVMTPLPDRGAGKKRFRVPLALSRLAQPVECLVRVPITTARRGDYAPELVRVPVTQTWLTVFRATSLPRASRAPIPMADERALALARSVVESVDQSVDSLADRPSDEVGHWISAWVTRYRQIASSAGHLAALDSASVGDASETSQRPAADSPVGGDPKRHWAALDRRLAFHLQEYAIDESVRPSALSLPNLDGYVTRRISKISASTPAPPVEPATTNGRGLKTIIVNCLTLLLVAALLACLWPAQQLAHPWVVHPAFWLGLIGVVGVVVAPPAVAAAIVFAAVALPVFPKPGLLGFAKTGRES